MPKLHDAAVRDTLGRRLKTLTPAAQRRWGQMTVDQMVWHCAEALEIALGRKKADRAKAPMPRPILRFLVLNAPWPKGAPTVKEILARQSHDLEAERARCLALMDDFARADMHGTWAEHPILGKVSGDQYSRLQAKHLNHHLTQFGA